MKKIFLIAGLVCFILIFGMELYAVPVGGIDPQAGRWTLEGTMSFDKRDMELSSNNWDQTANGTDKWEYDRDIYYATIKYGFNEWVTGYAKLGGGSLDIEDKTDAKTTVGQTINMSTEFVWGLGVQGIFWRQDPWRICGDAQYFSHSTHDADYTDVGGNTPSHIKGDIDEWQVSLIAAYEYMQALPYLGIKFSDWDSDIEQYAIATPGTVNSGNIDGEDNFGLFVGCDFYFERDWKLNLEGRFIDETSFSATLGYTF